jgi:hypothetical protein
MVYFKELCTIYLGVNTPIRTDIRHTNLKYASGNPTTAAFTT